MYSSSDEIMADPNLSLEDKFKLIDKLFPATSCEIDDPDCLSCGA